MTGDMCTCPAADAPFPEPATAKSRAEHKAMLARGVYVRCPDCKCYCCRCPEPGTADGGER